MHAEVSIRGTGFSYTRVTGKLCEVLLVGVAEKLSFCRSTT